MRLNSPLEAAQLIFELEGGFVNDPDDPGRNTNHGVTQSAWNSYAARKAPSLVGVNVVGLSDSQLMAFWLDRYERDSLNQVDANLGHALYDFAAQSGQGRRQVRRILGGLAPLLKQFMDVPSTWTPNTSDNSAWSSNELAILTSLSPYVAQTLVAIARTNYLVALTDSFLNSVAANGQGSGFHAKYLLGSLYRVLHPANTYHIPVPTREKLASSMMKKVKGLVNKHGANKILKRSDGPDITLNALLTPVGRSNFMWRDPSLKEAGISGWNSV